MAITRIDIETFLSFNFKFPVIDVRSEGEYAHAHIPGALSLPLFNNEERKIVGTDYKQQSRQKAIKTGLSFFGPKMIKIVETAEKFFESFSLQSGNTMEKTIVVHCWRGGMRSGGAAWLLDLYGFKVFTITGGYKAYRRWALQQLDKDYAIKVIGGFTGSGKTMVLQEMRKMNELVVDLEEIAKHKGSSFGNMGMAIQPSQEMFENILALELKKACSTAALNDDEKKKSVSLNINHATTSIWIEDESQRIGLVNIPSAFFRKMRNKCIYFLNIPFEERLKHILKEYGDSDKQEMIKAVLRIGKRLGGMETKEALRFLNDGNTSESFRILLKYYDKQYLKGLHSRENLSNLLYEIECETVDAPEIAKRIIAKQTEKLHAQRI